jgi:hypothetical protein
MASESITQFMIRFTSFTHGLSQNIIMVYKPSNYNLKGDPGCMFNNTILLDG